MLTDLSAASILATRDWLEPKRVATSFKITGVICGVRIEAIEDPLMRKIRYMDKLVDELAQGKAMEKILRA